MCYSNNNPPSLLQAIVPAAGLGSRFMPFSKVVPKELLPVITIPAVDFALHELLDAQLYNLKLVISDRKKILADYVSNFSPLFNITHLAQPQPLGLGHAVLTAMQSCPKNTVSAVLLPDNILCCQQQPFLDMLQIYKQTAECCAVVLLVEIPAAECFKYGIAQLGDSLGEGVFKITQIVEKPKDCTSTSHLAVMGRYLLSSCVVSALQNLKPGVNGEYQLTDAINALIRQGKNVLGYKFTGDFFDIGTPRGWLNTNNFFAQSQLPK